MKEEYETIDPVSYTHLDVYKRQKVFIIIAQPQCRCKKGARESFTAQETGALFARQRRDGQQ